MAYTEGDVYTSENFYFATQAPQRKPTLYFKTDCGRGNGRLRQSHPNGALIQEIHTHVAHAFFSKETAADSFYLEIRSLFKSANLFRRMDFLLLAGRNGGRTAGPVYNSYHCEASFNEITNLCQSIHKSEGTVISEDNDEYQLLKKSARAIYREMKHNKNEAIKLKKYNKFNKTKMMMGNDFLEDK